MLVTPSLQPEWLAAGRQALRSFFHPRRRATAALKVGLLVTALCAAAVAAQAAPRKGYALVVGISGYPHAEDRPLKGGEYDARHMAGRLSMPDLGFEVKLIVSREATRRRILDELEVARKTVKKDERFVLYFAGHGVKSPKPAIMAYDAVIPEDGITREELAKAVKKIEAASSTVILDTCFAGLMVSNRSKTPKLSHGLSGLTPRDWPTEKSGRPHGAKSRIAIPTNPLDPIPEGAAASKSGAPKGEYDDICFFVASAETQQAHEAEIDRQAQGIFTSTLLMNLREGKLATWGEIWSRVRIQMGAFLAHEGRDAAQTPRLSMRFVDARPFEQPPPTVRARDIDPYFAENVDPAQLTLTITPPQPVHQPGEFWQMTARAVRPGWLIVMNQIGSHEWKRFFPINANLADCRIERPAGSPTDNNAPFDVDLAARAGKPGQVMLYSGYGDNVMRAVLYFDNAEADAALAATEVAMPIEAAAEKSADFHRHREKAATGAPPTADHRNAVTMEVPFAVGDSLLGGGPLTNPEGLCKWLVSEEDGKPNPFFAAIRGTTVPTDLLAAQGDSLSDEAEGQLLAALNYIVQAAGYDQYPNEATVKKALKGDALLAKYLSRKLTEDERIEFNRKYIEYVQRTLPVPKGGGKALGALVLLDNPPDTEKMSVTIDNKESDLTVVSNPDGDVLKVSLAEAIPKLTHDRGNLQRDNSPYCRVVVGDRTVLAIPIKAPRVKGEKIKNPPGEAIFYSTSGTPGTVRERVSCPYAETKSGDVVFDLITLAELLGITTEIEPSRISLFTPEYWCKLIGLESKCENRTFLNMALSPDIGVSPPMDTLLLWVRPSRQSYVQIYACTDEKKQEPAPLLGVDAFGEPITHIHRFDSAQPRLWNPNDQPVRAETEFYGYQYPLHANFVAVVATRNDAGNDLVAEIRNGLPPTEWAVVGVRQTVRPTPIEFDFYYVDARADKTWDDVQQHTRTDKHTLRDLNGVDTGGTGHPVPGTKLVRVKSVGGLPPMKAGIHQMALGETIESLAKEWGVPVQAILDLNPDLVQSPPVAGNIVMMISRSDVPPQDDLQPHPGVFRSKSASGILVYETTLRQKTVHQIAGGTPFRVTHVSPSTGMARVIVGSPAGGRITGYVELASIKRLQDMPAVDIIPPLRDGAAIVAEAVRMKGAPYKWGGNSLKSGIDCSHFVALAFHRAGHPVPSPPVKTMEQSGRIVSYKPGNPPRALKGDSRLPFPLGPKYKFDEDLLQPGDRLIFQRDIDYGEVGSRHTGIYIGHWGKWEHGFVHASSRHGVTISDLGSPVHPNYYWGIYRYGLRDVTAALPSKTATYAQLLVGVER